MDKYILSCCSTTDVDAAYLAERGIPYLSYRYSINGVEYADDFGASMPSATFYEAMAAGAPTATAQINAEAYMDFFRPFLQQGKDILHMTLSSGLTGGVNSARLAVEQLKEEFPERQVYILDSLGACSGSGLLVDGLYEQKQKGLSLEALYAWGMEQRLYVHHWFFSTDLSFYVRGGRISKTAGFVGGLLGICPLMNMDDEGHLIPREKIPSKKLVRRAIVDRMEEHAQGGLDYSGRVFLAHSNCLADAQKVKDMIEERFPKLDGKVHLFNIGPTIGAHTGPGTVALFFWGDKRGK